MRFHMSANNQFGNYRKWYSALLQLYPRPYYERFGEGMEQTFTDILAEQGTQGRSVLSSVLWMAVDTSGGIIREQVRSIAMDIKVIARPALATAGLLLIPYLAMQRNWQISDPGSGPSSVNWTGSDFLVMGILLFGTGLILELVLRSGGKYRVVAAIAVIFGFLWLWAELAVGVFTTWGS